MRKIVIDTETTGLEIEKGHRIIEIGCVELVNGEITGNRFHRYINPQRSIDAEALAVHGITESFLSDKPFFVGIAEDFLNFIGGSELIAHNSDFDVAFIDHELKLANQTLVLAEQHKITDTLDIARKKFPGQKNTLDAICKRYKIDTNERKAKGHGALLDAELLARVYLMMTWGQGSLFNEIETTENYLASTNKSKFNQKSQKMPTLIIEAEDYELAEHSRLLSAMHKNMDKLV